jgi:hypothetical protein
MAHLTSALLGPPEDNMQDFWNTWYGAFAHLNQSSTFLFTNFIRFPEGTPLIYHSFAYPQVFAIALISKAFGLGVSSLVLQQNLSLLITFPLAATGGFYLVRHFTAESGGALLGGFVFAFNPSHVEHAMHHVGISQIEFIPFFVLSYLLTIERKSVLLLLSTILLFALNALSCWYYLFYMAYFILFHTAYVAIRDRNFPSGWQLITPIACTAGVVAALSPLLMPMATAAIRNPLVYAQGADAFVAKVYAYPAFPPFHLLGRFTEVIYKHVANEWEGTVYLGLVNLLVLIWLWYAGGDNEKKLLRYVLYGMAVFCIFASGDSIHLPGHLRVPMPDALLSDLPFFKNVRTPSRVIVLVYMFLAIGIGCAANFARRHPPRYLGRWGVAILSALIVLDFYPASRLPMTARICSPGLDQIRIDADVGFGVLDLPNTDYLEGNLYMFQQSCHGRPIMQGNTARNVIVSLRDRLETKDLQAQRRQLVSAKVKYIVINHQPMGIALPWNPADRPQESYTSFYPVTYNAKDLTVLRVY